MEKGNELGLLGLNVSCFGWVEYHLQRWIEKLDIKGYFFNF